jgi:PIN domain nuclease of toxin-antitoxin system
MIVLDTHAWIWYIDSPAKLSAPARDAIDAARRDSQHVYISCISSWEIQMLTIKKRLLLTVPSDVWISRCERLSFLRFLPVDNEIARLASVTCSDMHGDPADRMIAATALFLGAKLVTCDTKIQSSSLVECIW